MNSIKKVILLALLLASSNLFADDSISVQPTTESKYTQRDLDCLYKAVYNETRGNEIHGASMVVATILNRQQSPIFPNNVCGVVYQKAQFTNVQKVQDRHITQPLRDLVHDAVERYEKGLLNTSVLFFHNVHVRPKWSYIKKRVVKVGDHIFYR